MIFILLGGLAVLILTASYLCYRMGFRADRRPKADPEAIEYPEGDIYLPYRPMMEAMVRATRTLPRESCTVTSFDGLTLQGYFYEYSPDAPIELMLHGYRGTAERDLGGGASRSFRAGHSALVVDQRCAGGSGGKTITFGIREHRDCLVWVDYLVRRFGPDRKIILTGISMGAATVLMAAGRKLPGNVTGVIADCGYSSPKEIIQTVIAGMGLPPRLCYPFVRLGARLWGGFDPDADSPMEAVKRCTVPVIFFHGESDDFVPCHMSRSLYAACASRKKLVTVPGAGHGLCYPADPEGYLAALKEFFREEETQ